MIVLIFRSDPKLSPTDSPESSNQIENITDPGVPDAGASRINNCDHCICCNCKPMPTSEESICCKEMKIGLHIMTGTYQILKVRENRTRQAGAELCQAQVKLG